MTELAYDTLDAPMKTSFAGDRAFEDEHANGNSYSFIFVVQSRWALQNQAGSTPVIENTPVSVKTMIEFICDALGLKRNTVARLAGVSRAALYKHINGESNPGSDILDRYSKLHEIAKRIAEHYPEQASKFKSVLIEGDTIIGHLMNPDWDQELILSYVRKLKDVGLAEKSKQFSAEDRARTLRHLSRHG